MSLIRKVCALAEAVFTLILGGYRHNVHAIFLEASPYGPPEKVFTWKGVCSHSCLVEKLRDYTYDTPPLGFLLSDDEIRTEEQQKMMDQLLEDFENYLIKDELTPDQLEELNEHNRIAARRWRAGNAELIKARLAMMTPEQRAEWRERKYVETVLYRRKKKKEDQEKEEKEKEVGNNLEGNGGDRGFGDATCESDEDGTDEDVTDEDGEYESEEYDESETDEYEGYASDEEVEYENEEVVMAELLNRLRLGR